MVDRKLFCEVTGLTLDINELIDTAKGDADKSALLLKKLDWYIPEGAYLADSTKRNKAIELINAVSAELDVELSKVFVDVDDDGDVDAYDVIDTKEPTEAPTTEEPTEEPTEAPTEEPTEDPTPDPVEEPTEAPTEEPTEEPKQDPAEPGE